MFWSVIPNPVKRTSSPSLTLRNKSGITPMVDVIGNFSDSWKNDQFWKNGFEKEKVMSNERFFFWNYTFKTAISYFKAYFCISLGSYLGYISACVTSISIGPVVTSFSLSGVILSVPATTYSCEISFIIP